MPKRHHPLAESASIVCSALAGEAPGHGDG
jgi:hypothetical protein